MGSPASSLPFLFRKVECGLRWFGGAFVFSPVTGGFNTEVFIL